jgi:hypothetical protein
MRQQRIAKQRVPARRREQYVELPLDPRDADIVRVKRRQRRIGPSAGLPPIADRPLG